MDFAQYIRDVPNWPQEGVMFKEITPLLASAEALKATIDTLADAYQGMGVTKVMGAEARGFIFGAALAYRLGAGFIPARKPGKLPWDTASVTYDLEYGTDTLEMHADALGPDDVVLIVDDVLATGGTAGAKASLVIDHGAALAGFAFLIELDFLKGRERLPVGSKVVSLVHVS